MGSSIFKISSISTGACQESQKHTSCCSRHSKWQPIADWCPCLQSMTSITTSLCCHQAVKHNIMCHPRLRVTATQVHGQPIICAASLQVLVVMIQGLTTCCACSSTCGGRQNTTPKRITERARRGCCESDINAMCTVYVSVCVSSCCYTWHKFAH